MPQKNLKQKAASSMIWTALQRYSKMFIQFISGIILARLLTPFDYGCIGMLTIFMVLAETFIDGGFGSALIQKKRPTQEDYSTIFWWNMAMSIVMYAILYFCAPAISRFYNIPLLCDVLRIQGLVVFIYALNVIQRNQLKKKLNFKLLSIVSITTAIIALGVTVFMAYRGFGVWALVTQNLIIAGIPALVFWFYVKWRPIWVFSWRSFKELFGFGFYMFLAHLVNQFCSKISGLLIGKVYNPVTLGFYSKAMGTENMASQSIAQVMTQVSYPLYAESQDNLKVMGNMVKKLTSTIAYFTFPLMFVLMLAAKPLFVLLYSEKWLQSVPYFQILCLVGLASCLQSVNFQTIAAIGKGRTMFVWTFIKRFFGLSFIVGGLHFFGMKGLLWGTVAFNWFAYFVNIGLVSKYIGYKWNQQLLDLLPIALASSIFAVLSYFVTSLFHLNMYADGALKVCILLLLYLGWSLIFKPESYTYFLTFIPKKFRFWERKVKHL